MCLSLYPLWLCLLQPLLWQPAMHMCNLMWTCIFCFPVCCCSDNKACVTCRAPVDSDVCLNWKSRSSSPLWDQSCQEGGWSQWVNVFLLYSWSISPPLSSKLFLDFTLIYRLSAHKPLSQALLSGEIQNLLFFLMRTFWFEWQYIPRYRSSPFLWYSNYYYFF